MDRSPTLQARLMSTPRSGVGWWAVGLTVAFFPVAWVLVTHAIPWPLLDTAFAPVLIVLLVDAAAVAALIALVRQRERSILVIAAAVVALPVALFASVMLVLEVLFPH